MPRAKTNVAREWQATLLSRLQPPSATKRMQVSKCPNVMFLASSIPLTWLQSSYVISVLSSVKAPNTHPNTWTFSDFSPSPSMFFGWPEPPRHPRVRRSSSASRDAEGRASVEPLRRRQLLKWAARPGGPGMESFSTFPLNSQRCSHNLT